MRSSSPAILIFALYFLRVGVSCHLSSQLPQNKFSSLPSQLSIFLFKIPSSFSKIPSSLSNFHLPSQLSESNIDFRMWMISSTPAKASSSSTGWPPPASQHWPPSQQPGPQQMSNSRRTILILKFSASFMIILFPAPWVPWPAPQAVTLSASAAKGSDLPSPTLWLDSLAISIKDLSQLKISGLAKRFYVKLGTFHPENSKLN